jgi:hypothetical protein
MGSHEESDRFAHAVEPASVVEQLRQIRVLGQRHHRHQPPRLRAITAPRRSQLVQAGF